MRFLGALSVALIGAGFLSSCSLPVAERGSTPPPPLRVGTSGDYAPFSSRTARQGFTGFDIVVAERLAADLGRSLELVPFQWPNLVGALEQGGFDVAMSGVTMRADRLLSMRFTRPYAAGGAVLVVRAGDAGRFPEVRSADRSGIRLAVNSGGHLERVARRTFGHATIHATRDNLSLPTLLRDGDVDAVVSDSFEASTWREKDRDLVLLGPFSQDRKAYALRRDDAKLAEEIDAWLRDREADGWLDEQRRRFLGSDATWTEPRALSEALMGAMRLRFELMPYVAAVKRRDGLPIEDAAQERRVLEAVAAQAKEWRLDRQRTVALFEALIAAAKSVEERRTSNETAASWQLAELRAAVALASTSILSALRDVAHLPAEQRRREIAPALVPRMRRELRGLGLTSDRIDRVVEAVLAIEADPLANE